jgi:2-(1,2-epoxy-1,2-dihydrophenyl)acetyl-CoA isomerase
MSDKPVLLSVSAGHARIALNRPDRLNALTRDLMLALRATVVACVERADVKVISLTGAGKGFCSGQDLTERDPRRIDGPLDLKSIQKELFHPVVTAFASTPKPVVACVNGVAAGAGVALALAADIVVASESAKFVFSFSKIGLSVDAGLGRAVASALGPARAKALLMLGETLSAPEAAAHGLIWKSVPEDELDAFHQDLAERLLGTPATALSGIKKAIGASHLDLPRYLDIEAEQQGIAGAHPDYGEGVLAFLERRPPRFS